MFSEGCLDFNEGFHGFFKGCPECKKKTTVLEGQIPESEMGATQSLIFPDLESRGLRPE